MRPQHFKIITSCSLLIQLIILLNLFSCTGNNQEVSPESSFPSDNYIYVPADSTMTEINEEAEIVTINENKLKKIKAGEEFIQVKKAVIPESALTKDNNGKIKEADENVINNKVQFRNQKNINGKKVDAHYSILSDEENVDAMGLIAPNLPSGKSGNTGAFFCAGSVFRPAWCRGRK